MMHIENLERKLSQNTNFALAEEHQVSSPAISVKQTFDIEEVVKSHPEVAISEHKSTIKKQQNYISYLNKILFEVLDEASFMTTASLTSPNEGKLFRERILTNLESFAEKLNPDTEDNFDFQHEEIDHTFLEKSHAKLIDRFRNLDQLYEAQMRFSSNSRMVQDIVEDFIVLTNKTGDSE